MQINKKWRQQEIHKTYQQTNWKWQGATETVSASTLGPLGIVNVWPDSSGLPCFSAISISHSCQDRLRGGSDWFSLIMFLCGFVPVLTVRVASGENSSMTVWDKLHKEYSLTTFKPLFCFFTVLIAFIYLFVCCMAKFHKPALLIMFPSTPVHKCCIANVAMLKRSLHLSCISIWFKERLRLREHVASVSSDQDV